MAEHDAPKHTWRQRVPEILLEIGIIVFAITLSIQLHAWHERSLEREEEHEFLLSLKADLQTDLVGFQQDSLDYVRRHNYYGYLLKTRQQAAPDSLEKAGRFFYGISNPHPNDSQFEGLKSAGKLGLIKDRKLLNMILDLYRSKIPILLSVTHVYTTFILDRLGPYLDENLTATNLPALLATHQMQQYLRRGVSTSEIVERYHTVMADSRAIIREIDRTQPAD